MNAKDVRDIVIRVVAFHILVPVYGFGFLFALVYTDGGSIPINIEVIVSLATESVYYWRSVYDPTDFHTVHQAEYIVMLIAAATAALVPPAIDRARRRFA